MPMPKLQALSMWPDGILNYKGASISPEHRDSQNLKRFKQTEKGIMI